MELIETPVADYYLEIPKRRTERRIEELKIKFEYTAGMRFGMWEYWNLVEIRLKRKRRIRENVRERESIEK